MRRPLTDFVFSYRLLSSTSGRLFVLDSLRYYPRRRILGDQIVVPQRMRLVFDDPSLTSSRPGTRRFSALGVQIVSNLSDLGQTLFRELVDYLTRTVAADTPFALLGQVLLESVDLLSRLASELSSARSPADTTRSSPASY